MRTVRVLLGGFSGDRSKRMLPDILSATNLKLDDPALEPEHCGVSTSRDKLSNAPTDEPVIVDRQDPDCIGVAAHDFGFLGVAVNAPGGQNVLLSLQWRPQRLLTGNVYESVAHCSSCRARVALCPSMILFFRNHLQGYFRRAIRDCNEQ